MGIGGFIGSIMGNKTQYEIDLRQARSSPKNSKRGCLCKDTDTYSKKCCDGTLWAQGIGSITQSSEVAPYFIPYYLGVSDTLLTPTQIKALIESGSATYVEQYVPSSFTAHFSATGKFLWVAHSSNFPTKTRWYVTDLNQGSIGGATNLFGDVSTETIGMPQWITDFKIYRSNYATTVQDITFQNQ